MPVLVPELVVLWWLLLVEHYGLGPWTGVIALHVQYPPAQLVPQEKEPGGTEREKRWMSRLIFRHFSENKQCCGYNSLPFAKN